MLVPLGLINTTSNHDSHVMPRLEVENSKSDPQYFFTKSNYSKK